MTTLDTLYGGLDQTPDDWQARSVLADWYEENGRQPDADAVRWTVRRRKRPFRSVNGAYSWFNAARTTAQNDPESDLPEAVYAQMQGAQELAHVFREYDSLLAAELDLYSALHAAREKGWADDA